MDYEISKSLGRIPLSSYRALNKRQNVNLNGFMNYIGFIVVLLCGSIFGKYMQELHETKLWFSHIKQVEQEISLRTEAGFYYSYYKFAVHPQKSLNNVVYALMHDNSWLYGLLVFTWMLANIDDSTRVFFTVNLRENFALPFFGCKMRSVRRLANLFGADSIAIIAVHLIAAVDISGWNESRISMILLKSVYIVALTLSLSWFIRYLVGAEADTHIWTFVKAKIGLISKSSVPFETALYLCHGAFAYLDSDFFRRTSLNGCFPLFVIAILIVILMTLYSITLQCYDRESVPAFINHFGPETIFVVIQSVLCGIIAIFTLRMKYLWFPQISLVACILPVMISKYSGRFIVQAVVIATITTLLYSQYGIYKEQMANEQEFYDPDTVALMEWIMKSTESSTSWSGSMQLMAGVKACTGRYLANHPHFEDKWLRDRTLQLYQMYGRKTLEEMHEILTVHRVDYIILEDSICLAASTGCSTKDLVDVANEMDSKKLLVRFCDRLRYADDETKLYFKLVFENPTFRVYQVLDNS
ncbi:hypothetical protein DINM_020604 [Dirofilaria immitis]|nr:hypothetical protein [Dirofilaria immitis]